MPGLLGINPAFAAKISVKPKPLGCLIEPDRVADVGSQVVGLVQRIRADRGDEVHAGKALVFLRADVERANVVVTNTRAQIRADVKAARAALKLAEQKMKRAEELVAVNFVSRQATDQARAELEQARQKLDQGLSQQRIWENEKRVAEAQLALRTIRSPFAGIVIERFVDIGERVEEKPVMRIAVIDPLRIELMVPSSQYGDIHVGDLITVIPELPDTKPVTASVQHVDPVLDAASNTFRVRLSLPNPGNRLPAGLRCKVEMPLDIRSPQRKEMASSTLKPKLTMSARLSKIPFK